MPSLRVVLVDPIYEENVGYVARAMGNYGVDDLVLVRGCEITEITRERATHSGPILDAARRVDRLDTALEGTGLAVATTARRTDDPRAHHRETLTPPGLRDHLADVGGPVALVFGREDKGLDNDELARMDLACHLPTTGRESMTLGHAVAVLLYALRGEGEGTRLEDVEGRPLADHRSREHLHEAFVELLDAIGHPEHQRFRATTMFRRLIGRARPSTWEFHRLMGVFTRTLRELGVEFEEE